MKNEKIGLGFRKFGIKALGEIGLRDKTIGPPPTENSPFVYYAFMDNTEIITPITFDKNSLNLSESLIVIPGNFNFYGNTYQLSKEGLYRFVYPEKENQQRIVFEKNIDALLSGIAWIYAHGNSDDNRSYSELSMKALHSKIFVTCGSISEWTHRLLESKGIRSRIVSSLTLEKWNSYDNGHILIEVYRDDHKKWVVYDLDNDAYFFCNGIPLSLIEFSDCCSTGDYEIKYITASSNLDISNFLDNKTKYDFTFLCEARFANEYSRKHWYKRVMQVPMIGDGKFSYFFSEADIPRVLSYSSYYKHMNKKEFLEKFY